MSAAPAIAAGAFTLAAVLATSGEVIEREAYLMGTRVRLVTVDATRREGLARLDRGLRVLEDTEAELSTWRAESAMSALNRAPLNTRWALNPSVCRLLATVADWQRLTNGAFDPTVGQLTAVWGIHANGRIPSAGELARARAASGFGHLELDRAQCTATRRADVTIDVGAFGKGEALDRAARVMGEEPWLIDLGGQISVGGALPGEDGWPASIAHPSDRARPEVHVTLRTGSLSTSAGSERDQVVEGRRVGHILDPRTGQPALFPGSVTVWHESGLVADILSTALYVMGAEEGLRWAAGRSIAACFLVSPSSGHVDVVMTPAFRRLVAAGTGGRERAILSGKS